MAHVRKQVRAAILALVTGLTSTGARVSANRATPKPAARGIDIVVRTPGEQSQDASMDGQQDRIIRARLDITTKGASEDAVADALDQSAVEIELAIDADRTLGSLAQSMEYRGADLALNGDGERILGTLSIAYDVTVYTDRGDPETAL